MLFEIEEAAFGEIDKDVQKLFTKSKVDVEEMQSKIDGNRSKADELLGEKKTLDAKVTKLEGELKEARLHPSDGDVNAIQQKLDDAITQNEKLKTDNATLKTDSDKAVISSKAQSIAEGLTKDTQKAGLLAKQIETRLQMENGQIMVLNEAGAATIAKPEELAEQLKKDYPFLVDGIDSSGGGADGDNGKGAGGAGAKEVTRSDWSEMNSTQQSKFVEDGGKVIDD